MKTLQIPNSKENPTNGKILDFTEMKVKIDKFNKKCTIFYDENFHKLKSNKNLIKMETIQMLMYRHLFFNIIKF